MKRKSFHLFIAVALLGAAAAQAQVSIADAWVRGTVPAQKATGAFMAIQASEEVRLVSATSPVAGVTEIHQMTMEGNVMKMREMPGGLPVAKGATVELKPGGYHLMLMSLKQPLTAGQTVPITLTFQGAGNKTFTQKVEAPVRALGAEAAASHGAGAAHKH